MIKQIEKSKNLTREYEPKLNLIIAASYGGKWDIINAVKKFHADNKNKEITENSLEDYLETKRFPNPDLIIRSGGEQRLSNFYLWQSSYSELYFSEKLWPDFNKKDFDEALMNFSNRKRKFGVETG